MSQYGAGECRLCGAVDDYCMIEYGAGTIGSVDCRIIACVIPDDDAEYMRNVIDTAREDLKYVEDQE